MTVNNLLKVCPFCGVASEVPHETQEACIEALHAEIGRMRAVLEHVREASAAPRGDDDAELS